MKGRKRHLLVDTEGLPIEVVVHSAGMQDRDGARLLFEKAWREGKIVRLLKVWADQSYKGFYKGGYCGHKESLGEWLWREHTVMLEVVERVRDENGQIAMGFHVLPRRWVVERSFGWLGRYRRLSRDYEYWPCSSEAMIEIGFSRTMLRRLVKLRSRPDQPQPEAQPDSSSSTCHPNQAN